MNGLVRACFALTLTIAVAGCASTSATTAGRYRGAEPVKAVKVDLKLEDSIYVRINKRGHGATLDITPADREAADRYARTLRQIIVKGLQTRFAAYAGTRGLAVVSSGQAAPTLTITMPEHEYNCNDFACVSSARIDVDLIDEQGVPVWNFFATVGQASRFSSIDEEMFEGFEKTLLDRMESDGAISRK